MLTLAWPILAAAFVAVFLAELVGDKTIYLVSTLATRFRPISILAGIGPAASIKMLAAVTLGRMLAQLPAGVPTLLSAVTFSWAAFVILRERSLDKQPRLTSVHGGAKAGFLTIIGTEWGDPGQLAAAAIAVNAHAPFTVWLGSTAAMMTKAILAVSFGVGIRRVVPARTMRSAAVLVCVSMAIVTLSSFFW